MDQEARKRSPSWEGVPGSAVQTISCWSGSVLAVSVSQSRLRVPATGWWRLLGADAATGDVVRGPPLAELRVLYGEFADEGGQPGVVGVLGCFHAQLGGAGDGLPVGVQRPHGRVGEDQPDVIAVFLRNLREIGDRGGGEGVPGENVHAAAQHNGRGDGEVVEQPLQLRLDLLPGTPPGPGGRPAYQAEEVVALVVVQPQDPGQGGQDRGRRLDAALFEAGVVVGADRDEPRHFLPPQTRHPPGPAGVGQSRAPRADLGAPGLEELPQLIEVCVAGHVPSVAPAPRRTGGPFHPCRDLRENSGARLRRGVLARLAAARTARRIRQPQRRPSAPCRAPR